MKQLTFAVAGGDMRMVYLLAKLRQAPFCARAYGCCLSRAEACPVPLREALAASGVVVLGLPMLNGEGALHAPLAGDSEPTPRAEELFRLIRPGTLLLGGAIPPTLAGEGGRRGILIEDYIQREDFAVRNAAATAEAALQIALAERESMLHGARCLVLGYGRIGKALIRLLAALGARVSAAARKPGDLAWISASGASPIPMGGLDGALPEAQVIFNTVPALLLGGERLSVLGKGCLLIDLASSPGGIDFEAAARQNLRAVRALSLPGKLKPVSAGEIILDTVTTILTERGMLCE
jgi:dipicolinate synthase subunit A